MKGSNTLTLNADSMAEIIEWHLNNRMLAPGTGRAIVSKVESIKGIGAPRYEVEFSVAPDATRPVSVSMPSPGRGS